jgi:DMSO/TMAO reductase YedYZ molybdopterin-dependent catalytic subunit
VVFHAADDYTDSITLDRAVNEGAILAYEMNGAPLEKSHGFPARLLIPNIYGMKNVKWITRIELVDYDFKGYWMQRGWDDAAPYKISSRIDTPKTRETPSAGEVPIAGVAFAGERGIRAVEYSLDDGQTWAPAEVKPALATNTWQLWAAQPNLERGSYRIRVRATDGKGELQTAKDRDSLPDGATGYDISVIVVT